jgi:hypothetical protein
MADLTVKFAKLENCRYIAASVTSPYFCFEATTEDAVKRKVAAALAFYAEAKTQINARVAER